MLSLFYFVVGGDVRLRKATSSSKLDSSTSSTGSRSHHSGFRQRQRLVVVPPPPPSVASSPFAAFVLPCRKPRRRQVFRSVRRSALLETKGERKRRSNGNEECVSVAIRC
ncbi:hypothetical protein V7S43_009710 [Phytophthora oleae]|uniref:Uncharacterized protein n=1 Tax=Phytophthora oleae TaxID=2107226 RepID=A0ABD3FGR2_9STRA